MEYLNGGDLYSLLRNLGCLDEEVARVYIAEVVILGSNSSPLLLNLEVDFYHIIYDMNFSIQL